MSVTNRLKLAHLRSTLERCVRLARREWEFHSQIIVTLFVLLVPLVLVLLISTQTKTEILDFTYLGVRNDGLDNYRIVLEKSSFPN
ncbi:MAG: hypothetical protein ABEJ84_03350 [Halodesulfurarchaeum sp.]